MLQRDDLEIAGRRKAVITSTSNDIELPAAPAKMYTPHGGEPVIVQAHQPIEGGKGEAKRENREADKCDFAHPDSAARIAVAVLGDRKTAQKEGSASEKEEKARKKERPVQIRTFGVEHGVRPGGIFIH